MEVGTLDVNEKPVEEFEGVVYVEGSWAPDQHNKFPINTLNRKTVINTRW